MVVLTEAVSDAHLAGLRSDNVSYVFAGKYALDLHVLLAYKQLHTQSRLFRSDTVEGQQADGDRLGITGSRPNNARVTRILDDDASRAAYHPAGENLRESMERRLLGDDP